MIGWQHAMQTGRVARGVVAVGNRRRGFGQLADALANARQAIGVVFSHVMRHAADRRVQLRPAQRFGFNHLPGSAFDQVGAAEPHEAHALHHDDHVTQRGQISAACDARTHHGRDLRNAQAAAHDRVVIEDSARRRTGPERCRPDREG